MTPEELKKKVKATGSHYFDDDTMQFFGDWMNNYKVESGTFETARGSIKSVWVLYQNDPVTGLPEITPPRYIYAYFDKETFAYLGCDTDDVIQY
jgi:hypothetical protein